MATEPPRGQNFRMGKKGGDTYAIECGLRLRAAREALGFKKRPQLIRDLFPGADKATVEREADNLRKYEDGETRPNEEFLLKLHRMHRITFDWIHAEDIASIADRELRGKILSNYEDLKAGQT